MLGNFDKSKLEIRAKDISISGDKGTVTYSIKSNTLFEEIKGIKMVKINGEWKVDLESFWEQMTK